MKKTLLATVLALAMSYGYINTACAQSVPAVFHAVAAASAVDQQLLAARKNLSQMSRGLTSIERDCASSVWSAATDFQGTVSDAINVGRILTEMKSPEDLNTVRVYYFGQSSLNAATVGDYDLELVNNCLVDITTPAALAEATKIRDAMVRLREIFQPFTVRPQQ
jgi:hypothetical protein